MAAQSPEPGCQTAGWVDELDEQQGGLWKHERVWRGRQPWLAERGYMLRPRYRLGWKPSWLGTKKHHSDCEDGQRTFVGPILR